MSLIKAFFTCFRSLSAFIVRLSFSPKLSLAFLYAFSCSTKNLGLLLIIISAVLKASIGTLPFVKAVFIAEIALFLPPFVLKSKPIFVSALKPFHTFIAGIPPCSLKFGIPAKVCKATSSGLTILLAKTTPCFSLNNLAVALSFLAYSILFSLPIPLAIALFNDFLRSLLVEVFSFFAS